MEQGVPDTELLPVGMDNEEAHFSMSTRCREHIDIESDKGNRLQASENIWKSVAHALKAVAEQRGWEHDSHSKLAYFARRLVSTTTGYLVG